MVAPSSLDEFRSAILGMPCVYWLSAEKQNLSLDGWKGVIAHDEEDLVVEVRGGTTIRELNEVLAPTGQIVPYLDFLDISVSEALAGNQPHGLQSRHRSWKDWVLGMTFLTPTGETVKFGSKAVKNVAGFDFHKFIVGARGILGIPLTVILKTTPVAAIQNSEPPLPSGERGQGVRGEDPDHGELPEASKMLLERLLQTYDPDCKFEPEAWA